MYPWVGQDVGTKWEKLQKISIDPYSNQNSIFPKLLQANLASIAHFQFKTKSHFVCETMTSIFLHYVIGQRDKLVTHNRPMNTKGADLKLDPTNSCTHNIRNCSQQQLDEYYIKIQKGLTCMWCLESHLGIKIYVLLEQQHQCVVTMHEWQSISSRSHKDKVWIFDEEMFFIPLSLWYQNMVRSKASFKLVYGWVSIVRTICHHLVQMKLVQMRSHKKFVSNIQLSNLIIQGGGMDLRQEQ